MTKICFLHGWVFAVDGVLSSPSWRQINPINTLIPDLISQIQSEHSFELVSRELL